ncbi:uncharacterized protein LOC131617780 [Vicia villosa]|uniref:uncharacterized protein LOC131617780 n=1 Tax=Vicia villosa TaxID=3911 RepID=UPI00273A8637|nr:uncharacterized protein LOC131617780 [Vicia villosa]
MKIPEKLLKLKYHFLTLTLLSLTLLSLILMAPKLVTLFTYFWPLFLSTALVLALVFVFAKTSPLPHTDASIHKDLLDYVSGDLDHDSQFDLHNKSD